jgi:hypothetical protein
VLYTNARGKPRELILHADESPIGMVRAETLAAPESIKSKAAATRFGERFLREHNKLQVTGSVTITGDDGVVDPLLIRPGDVLEMSGPARGIGGEQEIKRVTLSPLEWSATCEFGNNSRRWDRWLARLAAGTKIKRR